ncbi:MAG: T9SS type A sorting domain-containing protein [Flavobacteriales bacterium]
MTTARDLKKCAALFLFSSGEDAQRADEAKDMITENKDWNMLSGPQVEALEYIAYENFYGYAGNLAQQILNEYYGGDFDIEPAVSLGDPNLRSAKLNASEKVSVLSVYPNPTSEYCIVQLQLLEFNGKYSLSIVDAQGKVVYDTNIINAQQQLAIDVKMWSSGAYYISLLKDGSVVETKEINVVR